MTATSATASSGWIEAAIYTFCIGLLSVTYAVAVEHGAHVVSFILYSMLFSGAALLIITGLGKDSRAIVLAPMTWVVGLSNICMEASYFLMLGYVTPTDANVLARVSIPMALALGSLLFRRIPGRLTTAGGAVVLMAILGFGLSLPVETRGPAIALSLLAALLINVRGFASEFHPWNRKARTVADKMRITGHVVFVTAVSSIALVASLIAMTEAGLLTPTPHIPTLAAVFHLPTVLLALFVGAVIFTAMNYLAFSSVVKIRTENFIATSAFMPVATLGVQIAAVELGILSAANFDWRLAPTIATVIAGVGLVIAGNRR